MNELISPKAHIGKNVKIGKYAQISENVVLGDNVVVGDMCKLGFDDVVDEAKITAQNVYYKNFMVSHGKCIIQKNSVIGDNAHISTKVDVGEGSFIGHNAYIRCNCTLGPKVVIGFNTYLSSFVEIGEGSIILNNCVVGSTSKVGKYVFISPSVMLSENKEMLVKDYTLRFGPVIQDYVRIGCLTAIISCAVGEFSIIGANSVVTKDVPAESVYYNGVKRKVSEDEKKQYLDSL